MVQAVFLREVSERIRGQVCIGRGEKALWKGKEMKRWILASASPRRKELLEQVGVTFEIIPAKGEEVITKDIPSDVVMELALQKAQEVAQKLTDKKKSKEDEAQDFLVLGADTVVAYDGKILGKPKDEEDAIRMLSMLSGNTHSVYTGVALMQKDEVSNFFEETKVTMYPMSKEEITAYVTNIKRDWEGKAGGYGIQDPFGKKYIKGIEGDYYNVVGLPVSRIYRELKKFGME